MDNNKEGWKQGKEVRRARVVGRDGEKRQKTVREQQLKKKDTHHQPSN